MMNLDDIKEAFNECEYPFYKNVSINGNHAKCTLYSIHSNYRKTISLTLSSYENLKHQVAIEIIKLRSHEYIEYETILDQSENMSFMLELKSEN